MGSDMIDTASNGGSAFLQRIQLSHERTTGPKRRSTKGQWTEDEDEVLRKAVQHFQGKNWKKIAESFKDRTDVQCLHRWQKVLNPELVKGPWSKVEDELINELVKKYGPKKWSIIAKHMPGRIGKQCRERWHNHLNPNINKDAWTQEEELILIHAHQIYGNKWAELTKFLPGRTDNAIKNHWNSAVKKKLDSYLASGLLVQLQGLPHINHMSQSMLTSSTAPQQGSEGGGFPKDGHREAEDISECSQETTEKKYKTNVEEVATSLPLQEVPSEMCGSSNFLAQDWKINPDELPSISSMDTGNEFYMNSIGIDKNNGFVTIPLQTLTAKPDHTISEDGCCGIAYPEEDISRYLSSENFKNCLNVTDFDGPSASLNCQIPNFNCTHLFDNDPNQSNDISHRSQEEEFAQSKVSGFCYKKDRVESTSEGDKCLMGPQDEPGQEKDLLELILVDISCSGPANDSLKQVHEDVSTSMPPSSNKQTASFMDGGVAEEKDKGSFCYQPPQFPRLDIPFLSCDLIQAGDDEQQEYSPLGIRQLVMSSANCLSPFRLWDSLPICNGSPDAVLKSSAETFTCTPAILKKRNRDLISPVSEKGNEKKLEIEMDQELFSNLARDFSRLEVMFFKKGSQEAPTPSLSSHAKDSNINYACDKENKNYDPEVGEAEGKNRIMGKTSSEEDINENNFPRKVKPEGISDAMAKNVPLPRGILVEHNMNDMYLFSPDRFGAKSDNINIGNNCCKSTSSVSVVLSPVVFANKDMSQLNYLEAVAGSSGNDPLVENLSIYSDTPFKKSFESPSALRSPWFFNTFLPGPRVDTDINIEDIGYFSSPGDRGIDAIGLMKQLSEQNAYAFAGAQGVLGDQTPETIVKGTDLKDLENISSLLSKNILIEKRVLDFSDCGTPMKENEGSGILNSSLSSSLF